METCLPSTGLNYFWKGIEMNYTKGERRHTDPDAMGGVNVFTDEEHIAYFDNLGDALLDIAAPLMYEALKAVEKDAVPERSISPLTLEKVLKALTKAEGR